jgi:hypothetical protein
MEMLIIGTGCALGYYMGDNRKRIQQNVRVSDHDKPSGPNIYSSNRVQEVDDSIRKLAEPKYKEKVKRAFPHDYQKPVDVFGSDYDFGTAGAPINFESTGQAQFQKTVRDMSSRDPNFSTFNPETAQALSYNKINLDDSPMFRSNLDYQPASAYQEPNHSVSLLGGQDNSISLLSGQKTDFTHNNMEPFFSSRNKQPSVDNDNSQILLEKFTGVPSSEDAGSYSKKTERVGFVNQGQSFIKPNISQLQNRYSRAVNAIKPENNLFYTPIKAYVETPFNSDTRPLPNNIDETRGLNNQKSLYSGVIVQGQKGSTRGLIPSTREIPKNNFTEYKPTDYLGNRASHTSKSYTIAPHIRESTFTSEYASKYRGPSTQQNPNKTNYLNDTRAFISADNNNVRRHIETFQPNIISVTGHVNKNPEIGGFTIKEQDKEYSTPNGQAYYPNATADRNVNPFSTTLREATGKTMSGAINPSSTLMKDSAYRLDVNNMHLDTTGKELLSKNKYIGQGHYDKGMGITQNKFIDFTTSKETLIHDNSKKGSKRSLVEKTMSYDSVFDTGADSTKKTNRMGTNRGNTLKHSKVGKVFDDYHMPTKENHFSHPINTLATGSRIERDEFNESLDVYEGRVEFGNHYNGPQLGDAGITAKHNEEFQIKDDTTVQGRFNQGLAHDNKKKHLDTEVYLKSAIESNDSKLVTKIQPIGQQRLEPEVRIKDEYNTLDRLNSTPRISNDLYPWLKKKSNYKNKQLEA